MNKTNRAVTALALAASIVLPSAATPKQSYNPDATPQRQELRRLSGFAKSAAPASRKTMRMRQAAPAEWNGRKFKGALIMSNAWAEMTITNVPYGIYDFTVGENITSTPLYTQMVGDWMSGAPYRGSFYGIRNVNMLGTLTASVNEVVDLTTYTQTRQLFGDASFALLPSCMAYDFVDGEIYGTFYNDDLTGLNWVKYNTKTLQPDIVCSFRNRFNVLAMAAAPDGNIYAINTDGDLYTIDRKTSRASLVGFTGVNVAAYTQSMTWDPQSNTLLWAAVTPTGSALYSLDPVNLTSTLVKRFADNEQVASIWIDEDTPMAGAPAAPQLAWNFSSPGAYDGNVSVTCPGAGKLTVWLDGEAVVEERTVTAGETVNVPFSALSERTHHASAVVKNNTAYSPVGEAFRYVGNDVPLPVTDLNFAENDGTATVNWTAPATGVEGGYLDPNELFYKVVRIPENLEVASHLTSTTFTEQLPDGVRRYAYRVTPWNGAKEGEPTLSNSIIYGQSYTIPYVDNFDAEAPLDIYTILDVDGNGQTWQINTGLNQIQANVPYGDGLKANDWLLSPKMRLQAGHVYRITAHMRNMWPGTPETIAFGFVPGSDLDITDMTSVKELEVNTPSMTLLDQSADFTVPADGDYKMALGYLSESGGGRGGIFMSQFRVEEVGLATAPAAATNLTVTPDPGKDRKATVAFTAPTLTLGGDAISGQLSANIYIDGGTEAIGTVNGIRPGTQVSWEDNTEPAPGYHTYTVRCSNASGPGGDISAREFIGIFTAPFHDDISSESLAFYTYKTVGFEADPNYPEMTCGTWPEPCISVSHFNNTDSDQDIYIVFPQMRLNSESVYKLSFKLQGPYTNEGCRYEITYGSSPEPEDQTNVAFIVEKTGYSLEPREGLLVLPEGGDYYIAFHIVSPGGKSDFVWMSLNNIDLQYEGSALAPSVVTDLVAASELTSKLTMKAPATDYAGRPLQKLTKVEVYRNGSLLPVHTFENPAPGEELEWTDENAVLGANSYFIVPSNSHGRGNAVTVKSFIGYDQPLAPAGFSIIPSADNQTATISWTAPRRGINGGVVDEDEMTYTLMQIFPATATTEAKTVVIKSGIKETSYILDRVPTEAQALEFYAVAAVTPQGNSETAMNFTILGKPYALPFIETFPNGVASNNNWINAGNTNYGLQALPTSESVLEMNGYTGITDQNGDTGVFLMLNGYNGTGENPVSFAVLSPKVALGDCTDPMLSFYVYNIAGAYQTVPSLQIFASNDEADFADLGTTQLDDSRTWTKVTYDLSQFAGRPGALLFQLVATAGGYRDPILMDNFRVYSKQNGIDDIFGNDSDSNVMALSGAILTRGALGQQVDVFATDGTRVASWKADDRSRAVAPGIYIVRFAGRSYKVNVK